SEAVRGEGAYLRNHAGERFMPRYSSQEELAPRDVVARAILSEMIDEQTDCQYLDLRHLPADKVYARFPTIAGICRQNGLDLATDLLPIAPAAHYCMGGVMVDTFGHTTVPNLYAVGEVACTGVHGANRLASNSLLEGLVYGIRIADQLVASNREKIDRCGQTLQRMTSLIAYDDQPGDTKNPSSGRASKYSKGQIERQLRELMWKYVSLVRNREGLLTARREIRLMQQDLGFALAQKTIEIANMLQVAELVVAAALERCESRGSHWRLDYQHQNEKLAKKHYAFYHLHSDRYESVDKEVVPHV
ncbi:MAG: FAD-binding protein, partial [Ktedonobacteraceae bacterium]|nr:FAD-binding protein [Ktedonobacteraceae bacterium]